MPELSKYDILLNEISNVESQILILKEKYRTAVERNDELEGKILNLHSENAALKQKLTAMESQVTSLNTSFDNNLFSSLPIQEREQLKTKLKDLVRKIDYHLSS